ncbi:Uncharacterized protein pbN1_02610 [Aromatoleum bremense]|nr:Uncharacterized protein pbN1_02610 [Aromatoleum bremense]
MVAHRFKNADAVDARKLSALQPLPIPPETGGSYAEISGIQWSSSRSAVTAATARTGTGLNAGE